MAKSEILYKKALELMPGGVDSPVRAFKPYPFFTAKAHGSKLYDVDGREYIDYCLAYGPLILGHTHPKVIGAVKQQLENGSAYGTPTELEIKMAEKVVEHVPCAEMVRFVNSGTEATMAAIRVARGYTGRDKIIKFEGCFHGAHDYVLVKAGSGAATFGVPDSLGVPASTTQNTIVLPYNDANAVEQTVKKYKNELAAIILEPVLGNIGCVLPKDDYLKRLREITEDNDVVLIFDEVITGFRLALGGAQEYFKVIPDIVTLGKIIGGGFPIGAFAGKKELMKIVTPVGKVYHSGTFCGNPISMAAGLTTIQELEKGHVYEHVNKLGNKIREKMNKIIEELELGFKLYGITSMFQIYLTNEEVYNWQSAAKADREKFLLYHKILLENGVFIPPSQFECCFISAAHSESNVGKTLTAIEAALKRVR